jgi:hypothetical protein
MKRAIFALFFILLLPASIIATGASHMSSIIKPVSINSDGVILCKTKFQENHLGALRVMPVNYGWALVFPDGEIKEYPFHYLDKVDWAIFLFVMQIFTPHDILLSPLFVIIGIVTISSCIPVFCRKNTKIAGI